MKEPREVQPREPLDRLIAFCEQVARDGILPSVAWFAETADALAAARSALPPPQRGAWANRLWEHGLNRETADLLGARIEEAIIGAALPRVPEPDPLTAFIKHWRREADGYVRGAFMESPVGDMNRASAEVVRSMLRELEMVRAARAGAEAPRVYWRCKNCHLEGGRERMGTRLGKLECPVCLTRGLVDQLERVPARVSPPHCASTFQGHRCMLPVGHLYAHHTKDGKVGDVSWACDTGRVSPPEAPQ